jgi:carbon storage regulator
MSVNQVRIGDDVKLTVLENDGSQVRIGIDAPKSVPVHREEIFHRLEQQRLDTAVDEDARFNVCIA